MSSLKGKTALITGATSGIGRATAIAFARAGTNVLLTGRREKEGEAVADAARKLGIKAEFVKTDITRDADAKRAVESAVRLGGGRLDIAFNNAGIEQLPTPLLETGADVYDQVMDTNVRGVWLSLRHEIAAMLASGGGSIINTSSVMGLVGSPGLPVYIASKHAVNGLTKSLALEFARQNIRINAVAPAAIETPMFDRFIDHMPREQMDALHPVGRVGKPEEVAALVLWLAGDEAGFVTGQIIPVDGGFTAQ